MENSGRMKQNEETSDVELIFDWK